MSVVRDGFRVMNERCDQCLFSKNKIVSDERRREILEGCKAEDRHFECHKSTLAGVPVCCRGFYDADRGDSTNIRVAKALGGVVLTNEKGERV